MLRPILIVFGFLLLLLKHYFFQDISVEYQVYAFLGGVLILGVPHGAADMMVAASSAEHRRKRFSISEQGRATQGVKLIRVDDGDEIAAISRIDEDNNEEADIQEEGVVNNE